MMGIVSVLALASWVYSELIVNYHLYKSKTQVNYDYSLHDLHAVMGTTTAVELGIEPVLTSMGADFSQDDRITLPPNDFVNLQVSPGTQFSLLFWVRPANLNTVTLIERYDPVAAAPILNIGLSPNGGVYVKIKSLMYSTDSIGITTSTWQMVTVVMDCSSVCLITAYRNLGETSATGNTGAVLTDNPTISFTLGHTQTGNGFKGKINEVQLHQGLISVASLIDSLAYAGTYDCPSCSTICGYLSSNSPPYRCLTSTSTTLTTTCPSNCGSSGISACTHYLDDLCFMVGRGCDSTCYTCLNGLSSGYCDTCYDLTNNWVSANDYWGYCKCLPAQYRNPTTYICDPCYPSCASCISGSSSSCNTCISNASLSGTAPTSCLCNPGYFLDVVGKACQLCDGTCLTCSGSGPTMCLSCYSYASLAVPPAPSACACNSGYFPNTTSSLCSPCYLECSQCITGLSTSCTVCKANAVLNGISPNSCVCTTHYFPSPTSANCSLCHATCKNCKSSSSTSCTECYLHASTLNPGPCTCLSHYYPAPDTANCAICHEVCQTCTGPLASKCTICAVSGTVPNCSCGSGRYITLTDCMACDPSCLECSVAGTLGCTQCFAGAALVSGSPSNCDCTPGYYPNPSPALCSICDPTCKMCSNGSANDCVSCYSNAVVTGSVGPCVCSEAYWPSPDSSNCQPCSNTCKTCSTASATSCIFCKLNATNSFGMCNCNTGHFRDIPTGDCLPCDPTCFNCMDSQPTQCLQCKSNASLLGGVGPGTCVCDSSYWPNPSSANCQACHITCASCSLGSQASNCTLCKANAQILGGGSIGTCICLDNFYPNSTPANCSACDSTCLMCSTGGISSCTACYSHAVLQGGGPVGKCVCSTSYWPNPNSINCQPCSGSCLECTAGDTVSCSLCKSHATLTLITTVGTCNCSAGYFPSPTSANCMPCDPSCLSCTGPSQVMCANCYPNASLSSTAPSSCQCDSSYFPNPTPAVCSICHSTCKMCSNGSANDCLSCYSNAAITGSVGPCVCLGSYWPNTDSSNCQPCSETCLECSGADSASCSLCKSHATLSLITTVGTCNCDAGYFPYHTSSNCHICDSSCAECSSFGSTGCTRCKTNAALNGTAPTNCICQLGFYLPSDEVDICQSCNLQCATCQGPESTDCLSCTIGMTPSSELPGSCQCNAGTFLDPIEQSCLPCDISCKKCSGPGSEECTECFSYTVSSEQMPRSCVCKSGNYPSPTSANCLPCDKSCVTCSGPNANMCLTCISAASLSGQAPSSCVCATGSYLDPSENSCQPCHSSCLTCIEKTAESCSSCVPPLVLATTSPSACQCPGGFYAFKSGCRVCPGLCATCESATACISCKVHSALVGSTCVCEPSYVLSSDGTQCLACDPTCQTCISPLSSGCLSCKANSSLTGVSPSTCACQSGYKLEAGNCVAITCDKTCLRCSITGVCLGCQANAHIPTDLNLCVCQDGYYPKSDATNCLPCSTNCLSCSDGSDSGCIQCKSHAVLTRSAPSSCTCAAGFFPSPNPGSCQSCPQGCTKCSDSSTCSQCAEQYYMGNSACLACDPSCQSCKSADNCLTCKSTFTLTTTGQCLICSNCIDPLIAYSTGPINYDYNITFNRPVKMLFIDADFSITAVPNTSLSWYLPSGSDLIIRVSGGPWANVASLLILFLTNVTDIYGFPLSNKELNVPPPLDPAALNETILNTTIATVAQASAVVVGASAVILGSTVGGGSLAMALLSQMQYFSYIGTANYSTTGTTNSFYTNLNQKSSIPNLFQRSGTVTTGRKLDSVEELIVVRDFLDSSGQYITMLGGIMALHIVVYLLNKVLKWRLLQRLEAGFVWSMYLYFWYFAFLDLQISALLQLKDGDWQDHSPRYLICTILASFVLLLTCLTPFAAYFFIYRYKAQLLNSEETQLKQRFGSLVSGLRGDVRWAKYLIAVFYFQRLIYSLLIVFMRGRPLYQSLTLVIPCGIMALFTLIARPMYLRSSRLLHIIAELDALLVYILLCFATLNYSTPQVDICLVIVCLTVKSFLCTVLIVIIHAIAGARESCRRKKALQTEQKIYVETLESTNSVDFRTAMWGDQKEVSFGDAGRDFKRVHPHMLKGEGDAISTTRTEKD